MYKISSHINLKKTSELSILIIIAFYLNSCGIWRPVDARKIPVNADERVKQNQEQGKGVSFGNIMKSKGGDFQFASSNEMWRATIDILDFVPLSNVDYGGGIIVTDWYKNSQTDKDSIKLMIQFLSNEIRSSSLKIIIHKKICEKNLICSTNLISNNLIRDELLSTILRKASLFLKADKEKK